MREKKRKEEKGEFPPSLLLLLFLTAQKNLLSSSLSPSLDGGGPRPVLQWKKHAGKVWIGEVAGWIYTVPEWDGGDEEGRQQLHISMSENEIVPNP